MVTGHKRLLVMGGSGKLGQLIVQSLLEKVPASAIAVSTRDPASAAAKACASKGVHVIAADYDAPESLALALDGIDRAVMISSNAVRRRVAQHGAVALAAQRAGVALLAYTSVLHADTSPMALAEEHRGSEAAIRASGVPFTFLRNGWYTENYAAGVAGAMVRRKMLGAAGKGLIASASRLDYAAAAAAVLAEGEHAGRIYELAGDDSYTLGAFAAEVSRQSGRPVRFTNMAEGDYAAALVAAGFPEAAARTFANCDAAAGKGALFDDRRQLSALIKRPTTPYPLVIERALASQQ